MTSKIEISNTSKPGSQGFQGWSPVPSIFVDGTRHVIKIIDWIGGLGTKPSLDNQYVGATGLVATAALAIDIRGASDIGDVVFTNLSAMTLKNRTTYLANAAGTTFSFPTLSTAGFEFTLINNHQYGASLQVPSGAVLRIPSSRSIGSAFDSVSWQVFSGSTYTFPVGLFQIKAFVASGTTLIYIF